MEVKKSTILNVATTTKRCVHFYLQSNHCSLSGNWQWDLYSDMVFCSDRFISLPRQGLWQEMTNSILHPDDAPLVQEHLKAAGQGHCVSLSFRIITSYGQIKKVSIKEVSIYQQYADEIMGDLFQLETEKQTNVIQQQKENKESALRLNVLAWAESIRRQGVWYYNKMTHQTWYSDGVFQLFGLQPQSLNAHLNTFRSFIHPDDLKTYSDVFYKTLQEEKPLHISYRIHTLSGDVLTIQQITHWTFSERGEKLLMGVMNNITAYEKEEKDLEHLSFTNFEKQCLLQLSEVACENASWQINLNTRKVSISDNVYRLFKIKPDKNKNGLDEILTLVHSEDQPYVQNAFAEIWNQSLPTDLQFRIIRPDEELRYIVMKTKLLKDKSGEQSLIGIFIDRTEQVHQNNSIAQLDNAIKLFTTAAYAESARSNIYYLVWDMNSDQIVLSPSFIRLFATGLPSFIFTRIEFEKLIRPDDRNLFKHTLNIVKSEKRTVPLFQTNMILNKAVKLFYVEIEIFNEDRNRCFIKLQESDPLTIKGKEDINPLQFSPLLIENTLDLVVVTDFYNNVIVWNKKSEDQFGIKREKVIGKNFFNVLQPSDALYTYKDLSQVLKGETNHLNQRQDKTGKDYFTISLIPIKEEREKVLGVLHIWRNVTNECKLQKHLSLRLNFIERILESTINRIIVLDKSMNYVYWNKQCENYHQLKKDEVIGKNILEVFPHIINYPTYEYFQQALNGKMVHLPAAENKKGADYFDTYLIPIKDDYEDVSAVLWVERDLTSEFQLLQYQRKADEILNSINEAYIELDKQGTFQYINKRAEELWGIQKERILGKNIWAYFPNWMGTEGYNTITKALNENKEVQTEYFSPANRWLFMFAKPYTEGVIVLFYDIQDIKEVRDNLQEEHRRLKEAQALGHIGSFERVYPEDKVQWSDELYRIHGLEPQSEEMTPAKFLSFIHPDDLMELQNEIARTWSSKNPLDLVQRIVLRNGNIRHVHRRAQVFYNEQGELVKINGTIQDVTDIKKAEEEITKTRSLLETAFNTSPFGLTVMQAIRDEKDQILDLEYMLCNEAARKIVGRDLTGLHCLRDFPHVKEIGLYDMLIDTIETGRGIDWEHYYEGEGMLNWFRWTTQKLGDSVFVVVEDISERKKIALQLQQTNELLYNIINAPNLGINVFKIIRDKTGSVVDFEFVLVNEKGAAYHNRYDLVGKRLFEEFPLVKEQLPALLNVLETGEIFELKFYHPVNDHWIYVSYAKFNDGIICLWDDITDHKRFDKFFEKE